MAEKSSNVSTGGLSEIALVPKAFKDAFDKVNACIRVVRAIANMEGKGGIKITKSESNWIIEATESGIPAGYLEEIFTICEDGSPVEVYLLVRRE